MLRELRWQNDCWTFASSWEASTHGLFHRPVVHRRSSYQDVLTQFSASSFRISFHEEQLLCFIIPFSGTNNSAYVQLLYFHCPPMFVSCLFYLSTTSNGSVPFFVLAHESCLLYNLQCAWLYSSENDCSELEFWNSSYTQPFEEIWREEMTNKEHLSKIFSFNKESSYCYNDI